MPTTKKINDIIDMQNPSYPQQLYMSLLHNRYATLTNHPIELENLNLIYSEWEHFFSQCNLEKERYLYNLGSDDGYVPTNIEHAKDSINPDLKEFYQIHLDYMLQQNHPCSEATRKIFIEFANLGELLIQILDEMIPSEIKSQMTTSLSSSVKSSQKHCMRFIHYPPCGADKAYRSAPHDDICLLTIIPPTRGEGLMMKKEHGWKQQSVDTSLVIFNSEMLEICTRGHMKSMTHQVTTDIYNNAEHSSRYSMPFFVHPHSTAFLKEDLTSYSAVQQRIREIGLDKITKNHGNT